MFNVLKNTFFNAMGGGDPVKVTMAGEPGPQTIIANPNPGGPQPGEGTLARVAREQKRMAAAAAAQPAGPLFTNVVAPPKIDKWDALFPEAAVAIPDFTYDRAKILRNVRDYLKEPIASDQWFNDLEALGKEIVATRAIVEEFSPTATHKLWVDAVRAHARDVEQCIHPKPIPDEEELQRVARPKSKAAHAHWQSLLRKRARMLEEVYAKIEVALWIAAEDLLAQEKERSEKWGVPFEYSHAICCLCWLARGGLRRSGAIGNVPDAEIRQLLK